MNLPVIRKDRVKFIKADGNYSNVHYVDGKKKCISKTLKVFTERVPDTFYRVSKSYFVNTEMIKKVNDDKFTLLMQCGTVIPISRRRWIDFKKKYLTESWNI